MLEELLHYVYKSTQDWGTVEWRVVGGHENSSFCIIHVLMPLSFIFK